MSDRLSTASTVSRFFFPDTPGAPPPRVGTRVLVYVGGEQVKGVVLYTRPGTRPGPDGESARGVWGDVRYTVPPERITTESDRNPQGGSTMQNGYSVPRVGEPVRAGERPQMSTVPLTPSGLGVPDGEFEPLIRSRGEQRADIEPYITFGEHPTISVPQVTFKALGEPRAVRIDVATDRKSFIIEACEPTDPYCYKAIGAQEASPTLGCTALAELIDPYWPERPYRVPGLPCEGKNGGKAMLFDARDAKRYEPRRLTQKRRARK